MGKLYLETVCPHLYSEQLACAYVMYDNGHQQPQDHKGTVVGAFYQDLDAFSEHLNKVVKPLLASRLAQYGYDIKDTDTLNQAPHPFFPISRLDGSDINKKDLIRISQCINESLKKHHQLSRARLFSQEEKMPMKSTRNANHFTRPNKLG